MGQIERGTLLDLLALADAPEQVNNSLASDLEAFRDNTLRQIADLPDGPPLAELADDLCGVPADRASSSIRAVLAELTGERKHDEAVEAMDRLSAHWATAEPSTVKLPIKTAAPEPAAKAKSKSKSKAKPKTTRKRVITKVDERRAEWIEEDTLSRLKNYGNTGLKEAMLVAGCRHRSPYEDLSNAEVLTILRRMKRENKVHFSAGRWSRRN